MRFPDGNIALSAVETVQELVSPYIRLYAFERKVFMYARDMCYQQILCAVLFAFGALAEHVYFIVAYIDPLRREQLYDLIEYIKQKFVVILV